MIVVQREPNLFQIVFALRSAGRFAGLLNGGLEPLIVFGLLGTGGALGMTHAQQRHTAALPAERAELEFIADRVAVLAASRDE